MGLALRHWLGLPVIPQERECPHCASQARIHNPLARLCDTLGMHAHLHAHRLLHLVPPGSRAKDDTMTGTMLWPRGKVLFLLTFSCQTLALGLNGKHMRKHRVFW